MDTAGEQVRSYARSAQAHMKSVMESFASEVDRLSGTVTSLLAFIWLYRETGDAQKVAALSSDILWLVLPSLLLFALLPVLLRLGWNFWLAWRPARR